MSQNFIVNEDTGNATFFNVDGSIIADSSAAEQPKVDGGAARALGTGDADQLDNVQLGEVCEFYGSQITENTGDLESPTYRLDTGVIFPNSFFSADEVFYKGNLDNLTGGNVIPCDMPHAFTGHYSPGVATALREGRWDPINAVWILGAPTGVIHQFQQDDSLTESQVTYRTGAPLPVTTGQL